MATMTERDQATFAIVPPSTAAMVAAEFFTQAKEKTDYTEGDLLAEYYASSHRASSSRATACLKDDDEDNDPTAAKFFDDFMKDPKVESARLNALRMEMKLSWQEYWELMQSKTHNELKKFRRFDFRLNEAEMEMFKKNSFVVSERMAVESFAEAYYRTYTDDLPVFVSADSILHAWHISFSVFLQEIETHALYPTLRSMLSAMHGEIANLVGGHDTHALESVKEVDYYLSVAISLLSGELHKSTISSNDAKVAKTLNYIHSLRTADVIMFGEQRTEDFSQFKPRSHYTKTETLSNYFRAMMWLGRIDFRLCCRRVSSRNQLGSCLVLIHLLRESNQMNQFVEFNRMLENFVGETDSLDAMSFCRIVDQMMATTNGTIMEQVSNADFLNGVEEALAGQSIGAELIQSHVRIEGKISNTERSFAFIGQKFTLDAFCFSHVTFDNIMWKNKQIQRRRPSGLDVAFSVLGNNAAVPEIVRRIQDSSGAAGINSNHWRDGKPYAHQLAALRVAVDKLPESSWKSSVYSLWLHALRALSRVPTERSSKMFESDAWGKRVMNAQLASWSELKHDTVLYAKQACGMCTMCEYPEGLVEPVPEFFQRMKAMAQSMKQLLAETSLYGNSKGSSSRQRAHSIFLDGFATIMNNLEDISTRQRDRLALPEHLRRFLGAVMEVEGGSGATRYGGWYPRLFFSGREFSGQFEPRIADVFTAPKDDGTGDPGAILHVGVGKVLTAILAVDGVAYAGPVFSYYEFETTVDKRLNDDEWKGMIVGKEKGTKRLNDGECKRMLVGKDEGMPPLPEWVTGTSTTKDDDGGFVIPSN